MGVALLVIGLAVFLGSHVFVSLRDQRANLVKKLGEGSYKGLFSLVSLLGLGLIIYGFIRYRAEGLIPVW